MFVILFSVLLPLVTQGQDGIPKDTMSGKEDITKVLAKHTDSLLAIPGVVGTGEGRHKGNPCVIVFVEKKSAALAKKIPKRLEEYPVVIREVGKVRPLKP